MTSVEIKKSGIEGLVGYVPVDDEAPIITDSGILQELEETYKKMLDSSYDKCDGFPVSYVLTPEQINLFLQHTIQCENLPNYTGNTGLFITQLIQNSYNHGHNNFTLNTTALKEIHNIGYRIEGTPNNPIGIIIIGNAGDDCGRFSKNCTFNVSENTGAHCGQCSTNSTFNITGNTGQYCGSQSKNSTYNITGNTGHTCGYESKNSTFNMTGNTGEYCGLYSEKSTYNITGKTGHTCGQCSTNSTYNITGNTGHTCGSQSKNSAFKTSNKESLEKMMKDVPPGNRIIFIKDGSEEVVRDYAS